MTFYSCEASEGNLLTLTEVSEPAANTPYILYAENGLTSTELNGWGTAAAESYTTGWLTGVYTDTKAPVGSYVLQNHTSGEGVAFYLVGSTKPTVNPFRAYIKPQASNVKAIKVRFDADGISATQMKNEEFIMNNAEIFNVAGHRLSKLQRGVNIINGKKVFVK